MIQFFKFNVNQVDDNSQFPIISGKNVYKFFGKRVIYLILFIYGTLFLTAAIPFVKTPFIPFYFLGGMATSIFLIRFVNHIKKFFQFKNGSIEVTSNSIEVINNKKIWKIPANDITYMEHNIFGNLVIRDKYTSTSFPLMLLSEEDREKLLSLFEDMAPKRTKIYKKIWEFVDAITVALFLAVHIIQFVIQAYYIPTSSMEDTLLVGDHLFVEKLTYGPIIPQMLGMKKAIHLDFLAIRKIHRGDIIIFRPPNETDKDYIKRCIAVAGDKVEIKDGSVYINGKKTYEPYTKGYTFDDKERSKIQGIVPKGELVVFGDNRENSLDGRFFGYLDMTRVKGKAFILYWNTKEFLNFDFSRIGLIK